VDAVQIRPKLVEFFLIRDDARCKETRKGRYGGVWEYIPLGKIRSLQTRENTQGIWTLSLGLSPCGQVDIDFDGSRKPALEKLCEDLKKLVPGSQWIDDEIPG
jgi:hypothetical protein